jgi:hypothetical protein
MIAVATHVLPALSRRVRYAACALRMGFDLMTSILKAPAMPASVLDGVSLDPMPQASPWSAARMPPAVLGIARPEYREYMHTIVARYAGSLKSCWRDALDYAVRSHGALDMSEDDFGRMVWESPLSRLLVSTLDAVDLERFEDVIVAAGPGTLFKVDHSYLDGHTPVDGCSVAPTVGLFLLDGQRLRPLAISVRDAVFEPADGTAFKAARCFFLQGCSLHLVLGVHPHLHFPMDSVIAVSRQLLPEGHPVRCVVEAHSYLHLPLNYGVLHNPRSVAHNPQGEIYAGFPASREDIMTGIGDCYAGIDGNSAYPGFRYPMTAPLVVGPYGAFLRSYYGVILDFCRDVCGQLDADDSDLGAWAEALHALLPGFPTAQAVADPEVLARALAGFVHSVSVWHSTEHHAYSEQECTAVPLRLRIPEPIRGMTDATGMGDWLSRADVFRHYLTREMFFKAHTVRSILDVDYGFDSVDLERSAAVFLKALRSNDSAQAGRRYIPLRRIACSLQF